MQDVPGPGTYLLFLFISLAMYVYFAYCFQLIAQKTNTPDGWMAWVPILNIYLMCMVAKRPGWWLILVFIPFINLIIFVILWMDVAKARGKPGWLGILLLVPIVNLVLPGYIAFVD